MATAATSAQGAPRQNVGGATDGSASERPAADAADQPQEPSWTPPQAIRRVRTGGVAAPLPEGVVMLRAVGDLRPGALERSWIFEPDSAPGVARRAITVLPSASMEDVAARLGAMGDAARLRVEITGTIQLHRGRNFLLVGMVTPIDDSRSHSTTRPGVDAPEDRSGGRARDADAEDADEIERRLRERLGPVPRGSDAPWLDGVELDAAGEGRVVRRRGAIRRDDETGGWRFVPETEHGGAPEPTIGLLPCTLLEQIERIARLVDMPPTLLLSGDHVRFRDRTFLLTTAYEVPLTGRSLRTGGVVGSAK